MRKGHRAFEQAVKHVLVLLKKENINSNSKLIRKWYYQVYVNDTYGNDVSNANILAYNVSGDLTNNNRTPAHTAIIKKITTYHCQCNLVLELFLETNFDVKTLFLFCLLTLFPLFTKILSTLLLINQGLYLKITIS